MAPGLHFIPHPLQFAGSVIVFVHTELQIVVMPAGQVHVPAAHVAPWGHALPHIPQLLASVCTFVHMPLQLLGVGATHVPPLLLLVLVVLVDVLVLLVVVLVDVLVLLLEAVTPPIPLLLELVVAPPVPEPPIPEEELDAVEVVEPPAFTCPPVPVEVLVLLFLVPPPQPIAAPCSATTDTASVSHDRRLIRVLLRPLGDLRALRPSAQSALRRTYPERPDCRLRVPMHLDGGSQIERSPGTLNVR
jgi:hypothetical protein